MNSVYVVVSPVEYSICEFRVGVANDEYVKDEYVKDKYELRLQYCFGDCEVYHKSDLAINKALHLVDMAYERGTDLPIRFLRLDKIFPVKKTT